MKILDIIKMANANLARNKIRTFLTIGAIFVGAFTLALTTGIDTGVNNYIEAQLGALGGNNTLIIMPLPPETRANNNEAREYTPVTLNDTEPATNSMNAKPITEAKLAQIKKINGIESASFYDRPEVDYITRGDGSKKYVISVMESINGVSVDVETGETPNQDTTEPQITIEPRFVEPLGLKSAEAAVGQTAYLGVTNIATGIIEEVKVKIVGVQTKSLLNDGYSYGNSSLVKEVDQAANEGNTHPKAPEYMATAILEPNLSEARINTIKTEIKDLGYQAQTIDDQIGVVRSVISAVTAVLTMFGAIALLAASFGIVNTLYMAVQERTREIGLMKAMGLSSGKVFALFSLEAIMIGFWGSAIGILAAMLAGIGINKIAAQSFLSDLTGFTLIQFSWHNILIIIVVICLIAFAAGTMPAMRAAKLNPIEALRYE